MKSPSSTRKREPQVCLHVIWSIIDAKLKCFVDHGEEASIEEVQQAQNVMMEARAKYMLRNQVVEAVMAANPILKAVHSGRDASAVER